MPPTGLPAAVPSAPHAQNYRARAAYADPGAPSGSAPTGNTSGFPEEAMPAPVLVSPGQDLEPSPGAQSGPRHGTRPACSSQHGEPAVSCPRLPDPAASAAAPLDESADH